MDIRKNESKVISKRLCITGIVQGVGFRPLVYRMALKCKLNGIVRNHGGNVEIIIQGEQDQIQHFYKCLEEENNQSYEIITIKEEEWTGQNFTCFKIEKSDRNQEVAVLPPDLPTCPECEKELLDPHNRRYLNPFTSCMCCGPRYTIMKTLPYDRNTTVMDEFPMCEQCQIEYDHSENRRFHAQTISCHDCGPFLIYESPKGERKERQEALRQAISSLKSGEIIAVKGIGGYHYVCSPFMENSVENLRKIKGRDKKPFAVMFENIGQIKEQCECSSKEEELLKSKARPITLLKQKNNFHFAKGVVGDSLLCGCFLPYTPIQILLIKECGPLIMTSANLSNQPIIREDEEMKVISQNEQIGVLYHERKILRSVDDSVARIDGTNQIQIIRRSRGYVPYPVFLEEHSSQILAMGGDLKASFALFKEGKAVLSQYFGDLEEELVEQEYVKSLVELSDFLQIVPETVICDFHPNYHSVQLAKKYKIDYNCNIIQVQHHHSHICSVIAEHQLNGPVIGIAYDGTGYGMDGAIWGSEFLICEGREFNRVSHLKYVCMPGGDGTMKDAQKTATCYMIGAQAEQWIEDERKIILKAAIQNEVQTCRYSSMGRLFDAVASILDICHLSQYEGESAILLEQEASQVEETVPIPDEMKFLIDHKDGMWEVDWKPLIHFLCESKGRLSKQELAYLFHQCVIEMTVQQCRLIHEETGITLVALSGGVFQNQILLNGVTNQLISHNFQVYTNRLVPVNDGGISLGQVYIGLQE